MSILPFPQSFCKTRYGFKTSSVFLLSRPLAGEEWGWEEAVGSPGELVGVVEGKQGQACGKARDFQF